MKLFAARLLLTVLIVLAVRTGHALANPTYFDYSSQLSTVPNSVVQNDYGEMIFTPNSSAGDGQAWLYSEKGTHVAGSSSITIASLGWQLSNDPSSTLVQGSPSTFNPQSFNLALTLTDDASHAQGTLYFQGTFAGVVPSNGGTLSFTPSIQTLDLGHNAYTVDLSQQTTWVNVPPGWMLEAEFGSEYDAQAQVTVQALPVQPAPEPASLALVSVGLATVLGSCLRERKPKCRQLQSVLPVKRWYAS